MDREVFEVRFAAATDQAVEIAARRVVEPLHPDRVFRVRLNSSYDGHPLLPGEVVHPEDGSDALHAVDADTAVDALWRDGTVPEWITLSVVDETGDRTVVQVVAAGRFAADERLFHTSNPELPPFHPVGPARPPDGGVPFSIHRRVECWTKADVDRLASFSDQVIFLDLMTPDLDAAVLDRLPPLPALTLVDHHGCAFGPDAPALFARMPALRTLRVAPGAAFSVAGEATCARLRGLSLTGLPLTTWGFEQLPRRAPNLAELVLAAEVLVLDGSFSAGLDRAKVTARRIVGRAVVPAGVRFSAEVGPLVISGADGLQPGVVGGGPGELADVHARP